MPFVKSTLKHARYWIGANDHIFVTDRVLKV